MRTLKDVVGDLIKLSPNDLQLIGEALVAFCPNTAEGLKNAISVAQQEEDQLQELEKQHAMAMDADHRADLDARYYGERV